MLLIPNLDLSEKIRRSFALFCNLIALTLGLKNVKGLRVTTIVKEIKFERVWGTVELKKRFQRQPFTKYFRLTLVFM